MYAKAVEVAKEYILAGDIFQVVLSQRFTLGLDADPFDMYRSLRQVNPSPYMYFLRHPELCVVGSSPEPMVQLVGGRVVSRPIAGTRRRPAALRPRSELWRSSTNWSPPNAGRMPA
jgi:anthranilate synthase component 1